MTLPEGVRVWPEGVGDAATRSGLGQCLGERLLVHKFIHHRHQIPIQVVDSLPHTVFHNLINLCNGLYSRCHLHKLLYMCAVQIPPPPQNRVGKLPIPPLQFLLTQRQPLN